LPQGMYWDLSKLYTDGTVTLVPEPAGLILSILGMGYAIHRKKKAHG
jgi:hypothetical protein